MKKLLLVLGSLGVMFAFSCKKDNSTGIDGGENLNDTLQGNITQNMTLDPAKTYLLKGQVYVKNNVTLTIPAGVTVIAEKIDNASDKSALIITRGSKLVVSGTADQPVVFTSAADNKAAGDWIGIIILGNAPTNMSSPDIPGFTASDDTKFGGNAGDDSSGSIEYLRVEYAGGLNPQDEEEWALDMAAGLSLEGVGSGTKLEHVMVTQSGDDGFQFVGGTVNGKYLIGSNNQDDNFDFDRGYEGKLQFVISYRTTPSTHAIRANGMESTNDEAASSNQPYSWPIISNMTIIGPEGTNPDETDQSQGIYIRKNTRYNVRNSVIAGYTNGGLMMCSKTKPILLSNEGSQFKYNLVNCDNPDRTFTYDKDGTGTNIIPDPEVAGYAVETGSSIQKEAVNNNQVITNIADLELKGIYEGSPDFTPLSGSAALSGSDFTETDFSTFFTQVNYRGAVGTDSNWAGGNWVSWK